MHIKKDTKIVASSGEETGLATGATQVCRLTGCTGRRVCVRWPDGKITHPCTKGMELQADGTWKICRT